jgi:hypothetical protein
LNGIYGGSELWNWEQNTPDSVAIDELSCMWNRDWAFFDFSALVMTVRVIQGENPKIFLTVGREVIFLKKKKG